VSANSSGLAASFLAFLRRRKKNIKPIMAIAATPITAPIAALAPVLSPVEDVGFRLAEFSAPAVLAEAPRVVGVLFWEMIVAGEVVVVDAEEVEVDVEEDIEVVEEEEVVEEILTPCASIVESEILNQELLATTEVAPCLNKRKLN